MISLDSNVLVVGERTGQLVRCARAGNTWREDRRHRQAWAACRNPRARIINQRPVEALRNFGVEEVGGGPRRPSAGLAPSSGQERRERLSRATVDRSPRSHG
jgi:hypothetical protein